MTLTDVAGGSEWESSQFCNRGWSTGVEIFLGRFDDPEIRLLAFFHEVGHCLNELPDPPWPYWHWNEVMAWQTGLREARRKGIQFSTNTLQWGQDQLRTYFQDDHPEKSPLRHLETAFETAFGESKP